MHCNLAAPLRWLRNRSRSLDGFNPRRRLWRRQSTKLVHVNGHPFKRLILPDIQRAIEIQHTLEAFGSSPQIPAPVMRRQRELWVEYIEGDTVKEPTRESIQQIAQLYSVLYTRQPYQVAIETKPYLMRLRNDLWVLHSLGALDSELYKELLEASLDLAPSRIWIGFDYADAELRNFVFASTDHRACAVDVEALNRDAMLGAGLAIARMSWLAPFWNEFIDALTEGQSPDFHPYWDFIELSVLAKVFKRKLLTGKAKSLKQEQLEQLRSKLYSSTEATLATHDDWPEASGHDEPV